MEGNSVGLPWPCTYEFLRLTTDPRAQNLAASMEDAMSVVEESRSRPNVTFLEAGPRHWAILAGLLAAGQVRGPVVIDAQIDPIAIEHGGVLATNDRDFSRFPGLKMEYPLMEHRA